MQKKGRRAAGLALAWAVLVAHAGACAAQQQSREDAWWTGPMLAPSAATLPQGHMLIEPYLYDDMSTGHFDANGAHHAVSPEHDVGSLSYVLYGLTDRVSVGVIPRFAYNEPAGAPNSSGVGVGDFTLQAGYGLTRYEDGHLTPAIAVVLDETLPSGRYQRLARPSDGFGAGAYTTGLSVYSQDYLWMPNGRILRVRLDLTYSISSSAGVHDRSVYGTPAGFSGHAYPGDSFTADAAAEYSLTRSWVLALDVVYAHSDNTHVSGAVQPGAAAYEADSGSAYSIAVAPAIEYNFSARIGALLGVRLYPAGRNTSASITPAIALNMVF
jgi:outer membrane putative beta-barrel porin/alpha-amylase